VKKLPPLALLQALFEEREPGILRNRVDRGLNGTFHPAGDVAGWLNGRSSPKGRYWKIKVGTHTYNRSRVMWKLHTGHDPLGVIDHRNGDRTDDRFENLRDVVSGQNARNKGLLHDGSLYVGSGEYVDNGSLTIRTRLHFGIALWRDENAGAIQLELHNAIAPIIDRIYGARRGRQRPPSEKV
jgi:hypothetical protein